MEKPESLYAAESEAAVLTLLLQDSSLWGEVSRQLKENDFAEISHRYTYSAVASLVSTGSNNYDLPLVLKQLRLLGQHDAISSSVYDLYSGFAVSAALQHHIDAVLEASRKRQLQSSFITGGELLNNGKTSFEIADIAVNKIDAIRKLGSRHAKIQPLASVIGRFMEQRQEPRGPRGLITGFCDLDREYSGFGAGDLVVIAARPGLGKTTFTLSLAVHAAVTQGKKVLFISLEMPEDQLLEKVIAATAELHHFTIEQGISNFTDRERYRFDSACARLSGSQLTLHYESKLALGDVEAYAKELQPDMIVIDYLQRMSSATKYENRTNEVGAISRGLKSLALQLGIPIIALSQLSRELLKRQDKRPNLGDLRESGDIEADADAVIFIHRDDYYDTNSDRKNEADILVAKNRHGKLSESILLFQADCSRFCDYAFS